LKVYRLYQTSELTLEINRLHKITDRNVQRLYYWT